jgi:indole-3-glycerol phosphate synthase
VSALEPILAATRQEVDRRRTAPLEPRDTEVRDFTAALSRPGLSLIAEHKRRSPSAGVIREELTLEDVVGAYERGGAAAVSVLTEGPNFGGSLEDLRRARAASTLPILRKDFTIDPYQVDESFAAGADAILLIVAALDDPQLAELRHQAAELGLAALVEVHDDEELRRALAAGARVIGVNQRDLRTFAVDTDRARAMAASIPSEVIAVAESGIRGADDARRLAEAGYDAILVGETLVRAADRGSALRSLVGHPVSPR